MLLNVLDITETFLHIESVLVTNWPQKLQT